MQLSLPPALTPIVILADDSSNCTATSDPTSGMTTIGCTSTGVPAPLQYLWNWVMMFISPSQPSVPQSQMPIFGCVTIPTGRICNGGYYNTGKATIPGSLPGHQVFIPNTPGNTVANPSTQLGVRG